jgi:hypothetical protein
MHMKLTCPAPDGTPAMLEVDGVNISRRIRAEDFHITMDGPAGRPAVHLTLWPETLVVDGEVQDGQEFALALGGAVQA